MARVSEPSSVYKKYLSETEEYANKYSNLLGNYTSQVASSQSQYQNTVAQLSAETSANISQAYSNYLAKQRAYIEYPEISSGDVARLSDRDLSYYETAYEAYKANEQSGLASAYNKMLSEREKYSSTFESRLESLNKDLSKDADKIRAIEDELVNFATNLGYDVNKEDLTEEYLKTLAGYRTTAEGGYEFSNDNLYTYLSKNGDQDLADYYLEHKADLDQFFLGDFDISNIDLSNSTQAQQAFRLVEEQNELNVLKKDAELLGLKLEEGDSVKESIKNYKEAIRQEKINRLIDRTELTAVNNDPNKTAPSYATGNLALSGVDSEILDAVAQGVFNDGDVLNIKNNTYLVKNNTLYNISPDYLEREKSLRIRRLMRHK